MVYVKRHKRVFKRSANAVEFVGRMGAKKKLEEFRPSEVEKSKGEKMRTCPWCGGRGSINSETCDTCDGGGLVEA